MDEEIQLCSWCDIDPPTPGYLDAEGDPICKGCHDDAVRTMGWESEED
jgi:hypothetical protein